MDTYLQTIANTWPVDPIGTFMYLIAAPILGVFMLALLVLMIYNIK